VVNSRSNPPLPPASQSATAQPELRTFLANHAQAIRVADLSIIQTLTFQTLYVIFFISMGVASLSTST
jgi:hypothetical protein